MLDRGTVSSCCLLIFWGLAFGEWSATGSAHAQSIAPRKGRELLALHGIDASLLANLRDGEEVSASEEAPLLRWLQRLPRFPRSLLDRWSRERPLDWKQAVSRPEEARGEVFALRGLVLARERIEIAPGTARLTEFSHYYRVTLSLDEPASPANVGARIIVNTLAIPSAWMREDPRGERAGALGMFVKVGLPSGDQPTLICVAERVGWFPERPSSRLKTTPAQIQLAEAGFDLGLLDAARAGNKQPLTAADRESFYQFLAAVRRGPLGGENPTDSHRAIEPDLPIGRLLQHPTEWQGERFRYRGIARRVAQIWVEDPEIESRLGIDHYYQIDLFVDLDRQIIQLRPAASGGTSPQFAHSYPITVCVPQLPPGLAPGESVRENITGVACFYKLWAYSSDFVEAYDPRQQQVGPILIGAEVTVLSANEFNPGFGMGLATLVLVSLAGLAWGMWRSSRAPSPRASRQRSETVPPGFPGSAESGGKLPERPDFSNLGGP